MVLGQDEDYIIDVPFESSINEKGLGHELFISMRKYRKLIAQYLTDTGEEETYGEILGRCIRTAIHIQRRGLTRDDIVILSSYNQRYSSVPFIACLFLGIPVASLDPNLSLIDIKHLIREVKPKILFVVKEAYDLIKVSLEEAEIHAEIVVYGGLEDCTAFADFLEPVPDEEKFLPVEIDDPQATAVIVFSSGTTGLPKGIMLSYYAILCQGLNLANSGNIGPVFLTYASLYWISAIIFMVASTITGGAKVICKRFSSTQIWDLIEKYRINAIFMVPPMAIELIKVGRPDGVDTTSLCVFLTAGSCMSEKHTLELRDLLPGTFVLQVYGQSEVAGVVTHFRVNDVKETLLLHYKPTSVGKIVAGITCKVVDPETEETCGPNQNGELRVKSSLVMNGYYNRDASESFDSDGWLRTGDIVHYDEDRCFYIVDRIKELLKFKCWHVPPAMIEQVLTNHPAVRNAVVIGIPHEEDGDHPMAVVILNKGYDAHEPIAEDIANFVAERVPDRMLLRAGVRFAEQLPLTPSGKIKRKLLKQMVLQGEI